MKLIAGLGNPGAEYENTRHNIGFKVIDLMSQTFSIPVNKTKGKSLYGKGDIEGNETILLKPQTFMNLSGNSIQEIRTFYKIDISDIIIIHDDIDLAYGITRIKKTGGHGGHNGIRSIINVLSQKDFIRIKAGVGRPDNPKFPIERYVLSNFNSNQKKELEDFLITLMNATRKILSSGVKEAMNEYNTRNAEQGSSIR